MDCYRCYFLGKAGRITYGEALGDITCDADAIAECRRRTVEKRGIEHEGFEVWYGTRLVHTARTRRTETRPHRRIVTDR
ncbi:MAG TPA: hypothetical protein VMB81_02755 [Candidatus Sulfotelmatobacter sp.]|nr:hypothetical protein [Candidatus Sulfotelmatobacter sp.]